jgi:predicted phage terminase large subunit-like protein
MAGRGTGGGSSVAPPVAPATARHEIVRKIETLQEIRRQWLRRQILEYDRIDLLCTEVLGYKVAPHHLRMMQHQHRHPQGNLCLCWRGAGKTTVRTVARCIFLLLKDPNRRILLASKSGGNAQTMLREVRQQFESQRFRDVFGDWQGGKWDDTEITVSRRTAVWREASVTAVGIEGSVVSKHFDVILGDDLVDEEYARTAHMRAKVHTWFYKSLLPTLVPGGELSVSGTRYHHQDLHGHFAANDFKASTLVIPALVQDQTAPLGWRSNWPDLWPVETLLDYRGRMGSINFDSQYQCDTTKMVGGGVFDVDHCLDVSYDAIPANLPRYLGSDLAISQKASADLFVVVVIAYDMATDTVYVLDHFSGRCTFVQQQQIICELADMHHIARGGVEAQQYQEAQVQELRRKRPDLPIVPIRVKHDKHTRAWRLTPRFEAGRVRFRKGLPPPGKDGRHPYMAATLDKLIEGLVLFPNGEHDDDMDGLDHAIRVATMRTVRSDRSEPGLL